MLISIKIQDAVSVTPASQLLEEDAAAINTVESMVSLSTDNATAMKDTTTFWEPAEAVDIMKLSTELPVSATLDIPEESMETVSFPIPDPNATTTKDMMLTLEPVSVSREPPF